MIKFLIGRSMRGESPQDQVGEKIDCFHCKYFYITWDPHFPNGCKVFGFKTRMQPAALVRESTGTDCITFEPKTKTAGTNSI